MLKRIFSFNLSFTYIKYFWIRFWVSLLLTHFTSIFMTLFYVFLKYVFFFFIWTVSFDLLRYLLLFPSCFPFFLLTEIQILLRIFCLLFFFCPQLFLLPFFFWYLTFIGFVYIFLLWIQTFLCTFLLCSWDSILYTTYSLLFILLSTLFVFNLILLLQLFQLK